MGNNYVASAEIVLPVSSDRVWEVLTNPEQIKKYLFGTNVVTDWKVGSPILWKGIWQGTTYEDKGVILRFVPNSVLETTYWSSMSGLPDKQENYKTVTYELTSENQNTRLVVTQVNNQSEDEKNHSEQNWKLVLDGIKKVLNS